MDNMFNTGYSIEMYRIIENDFVKFINCVPLEEEHLKVYSPKLADMMIRLGSQIDTFFKEWLKCPHFDNIPNVNTYRNKDRLSINDYRDFFNLNEKLSDREIFIRSLNYSIKPFEEFGNPNGVPIWWTGYNNQKHHAFEKRKEATLKNVLFSLSALFLLNCLNSDVHWKLVEFNFTGVWGYEKKEVLEKRMGGDYARIIRTPDYFNYILEFKR